MRVKNSPNSFNIAGYKFWLDKWYRENLDVIKYEAIANKWDGVMIVFGMEGSGKSTIVSQSCLYLDHAFNISKCVFDVPQFDQAIEDAKPESSIQWDEAITGADAALHASKIQQAIISKLTQIRKKRLKIFLCFPYINMLRYYFVNRCLGAIYVYAKDFDDRGYGLFFSQPKLERLYGLCKERFRYNNRAALKYVKSNFYFRFDKTFCLPENEYDKKKEEARKSSEKNLKENLWKNRLKQAINYAKSKGILHKELASVLDMTPSALAKALSS